MESKITTNAMDLPSSCHSRMNDLMEEAIANEAYSIASLSDNCCSELQACEQRMSAELGKSISLVAYESDL